MDLRRLPCGSGGELRLRGLYGPQKAQGSIFNPVQEVVEQGLTESCWLTAINFIIHPYLSVAHHLDANRRGSNDEM